jgi:hypothetical protein
VSFVRARLLVIIGVCLTASGVLAYFQLERRSFISTGDFQFFFLARDFIPLLISGLVMTFVGSVMWGWRAAAPTLLSLGVGSLGLSVLAWTLIPMNIHDWTFSLMLVLVTTFVIGLLFVIMAASRYASRLIR